MSISQLQHGTINQLQGTDADLFLRLRIALSVKKRAGWHLVRMTVQHGVVQLVGVVPAFYDRQLIAALVRHVAGVRGIEDKLEVGDPSIRQQVNDVDETVPPSDSKPNAVPLRNPFAHLAALPESLDEVLAARMVSIAPAI